MKSNNSPIISGTWGESTWELYESAQQPDPELCTAVGCVAIVDLDSQTVAMTRNTRSGENWEMPSGHIEPGEQLLDALRRETDEEVGFIVDTAQLFGYREIHRPSEVDMVQLTEREAAYPELSYLPYYYAYTEHGRTLPTGHEIAESGDFTLAELRRMATQGGVHNDELVILELGLHAAQQARA